MILDRRTLPLAISLLALGVSQSVLPIAGTALHTVEAEEATIDLRGAPIVGTFLAANEAGLSLISEGGLVRSILAEGPVRAVVRAGAEWFALGDRGIFASSDLAVWTARGNGLPVKTIKKIDSGQKSFERVSADLKDLEADPANPLIMVTATKDLVFLTRDGGRNWRDIGFPQKTNGLKAVAVASLPHTVVFASHAIYGIYYLEPDSPGAAWKVLSAGLALMETTKNPDEVADIKVVLPSPAVTAAPIIYASQTFKTRLYTLDWAAKTFKPLWAVSSDLGTIDSLDSSGLTLRFVRDRGISEYDPLTGTVAERPDLAAEIAAVAEAVGSPLHALVSLRPDGSPAYAFSELWLLDADAPNNVDGPSGREGLYLPPNHFVDPSLLARHLETIRDRNLNLVVLDMKDDYGRLRFTPRTPRLQTMSRVYNPVDLESFVATMKERKVWLVARIVVFKDPALAKWSGGKYAVWDGSLDKPWVGYYNLKKAVEPPPAASLTAPADGGGNSSAAVGASAAAGTGVASEPVYEYVKTYYDENWVDPYSEEVWTYIGDVAQELIDRGFDEIQFDYIRFPTDGINLGDARYRWRDPGMDMESALLSFLGYIRSRIRAPISIDIYGANGWYRTGARTGQEVEMAASFVDVICPMYYPSHFEQDFMAQAPANQRPYRIYYQGTLRAARIARGRVIIRPYVQAFYLNVAYDRLYYNQDYVRLEVQGVRDALSPGFTYWNNSGRYEDIPR